MTKRSFFRRFGALIASIALAPEIAFNVKLLVQLPAFYPEVSAGQWKLFDRPEPPLILTDSITAAKLEKVFATRYARLVNSPPPESSFV